MSPVGLSHETSRCWMSEGNGARHKIGRRSRRRSKSTPPMPALAASQSPPIAAGFRTTSAIDVGRSCKDLASHSQSASSAWLWRVRWTRPFLSARTSASCMCEKRPSDPGSATVMLRSSPMSCRQALREHRVRDWKDVMSSMSRSARCGGNSMVPLTLSTSQPRSTFVVAQHESPLRSFFTLTGSWRGSSPCSKGRKTRSNEWRRDRRTRFRRARSPCAKPRKSSTKTSMYASGLRL